MFGGKKKKKVEFPRNKTLVIGIIERQGTQVAKVGVGELIREVTKEGASEVFEVVWSDGRKEQFVVPSYSDVFHIYDRQGGSLLFLYIPEPGVAIPIEGVVDAYRKLRFKSKEDAEKMVEKLKEYNPELKVELYEKDGDYIVEFPVKSFDLDREIPFREAYYKQYVRANRYKMGFWDKYGPTLFNISMSILVIIAIFLVANFVQGVISQTAPLVKTLAAINKTMAQELNVANKMLQTAEVILKHTTTAGGVSVPPG